jgi:hypothetical protein
MDELSVIKQRLDLLEKSADVNNKSAGMEFERISKAFGQLGNLLDLLYLEVSVLIETLGKKDIIKIDEFQKALEETAVKVEEQLKKAAAAGAAPVEDPKIEKL